MFKHILFFSFLLFFFTATSFSQKVKKIQLKHANSLEYDEKLGKKVKRLIGNVSFEHEGVWMFCDSAFFYPDNSLQAFGNVQIKQGDSITMFGDLLKYNGNNKQAEIQKNIRLNDKEMMLTTDRLNYNMNSSVATYTDKGKIISKDNILTSQIGYYNSRSKEFTFKKDVVLQNPQYTMNCDTLRYNTFSKTAYFSGPTTIRSTENLIYCEDGFYDTNKDLSQFGKNSYILTKEQKLKGDQIYYDRKNGFGRAINNVEIIDSLQNITIKGNYAEHFEVSDKSVVTGNALFMQKYDKDTLFLHADTLKAIGKQTDKKTIPDSNNTNILLAYHNVKFFKTDMQGKTDSLAYSFSDSVMRLYKEPVLWSDKNQLTADHIEIRTSNGKLSTMEMQNTAFVASQEDSAAFNQIKGKNMKGFFKENKLYKIFVAGNGQTIYYAKEKNKSIGVNRTDCSDIIIFLKDNQIDKISFLNKPDATMYPMGELSPKDLIFKDFKWQQEYRPLTKKDIFKK